MGKRELALFCNFLQFFADFFPFLASISARKERNGFHRRDAEDAEGNLGEGEMTKSEGRIGDGVTG